METNIAPSKQDTKSNVYEILFFNKSGMCLYHHDLSKSKREGELTGLIDCDLTSKEIKEK